MSESTVATPAEVLEKYFEAVNNHDVDGIDAVSAEEILFLTPIETLDKPTFLKYMRALFDGFPDLHFEHDEPETEGDLVTVPLVISGTHTATFALPAPGLKPVEPTGTRVVLPKQRFAYTVSGQRLVRIECEPVPGGGIVGILEQIGVKLPPLWILRTVSRIRRFLGKS